MRSHLESLSNISTPIEREEFFKSLHNFKQQILINEPANVATARLPRERSAPAKPTPREVQPAQKEKINKSSQKENTAPKDKAENEVRKDRPAPPAEEAVIPATSVSQEPAAADASPSPVSMETDTTPEETTPDIGFRAPEDESREGRVSEEAAIEEPVAAADVAVEPEPVAESTEAAKLPQEQPVQQPEKPPTAGPDTQKKPEKPASKKTEKPKTPMKEAVTIATAPAEPEMTKEESYKAMLTVKQRQARENAERVAEEERKKQEQIRFVTLVVVHGLHNRIFSLAQVH